LWWLWLLLLLLLLWRQVDKHGLSLPIQLM
jgi:hypothetical protein